MVTFDEEAGLNWAAARRMARSGCCMVCLVARVAAGRTSGVDLVDRSLLFSVILLKLRLAVVRLPRRWMRCFGNRLLSVN